MGLFMYYANSRFVLTANNSPHCTPTWLTLRTMLLPGGPYGEPLDHVTTRPESVSALLPSP